MNKTSNTRRFLSFALALALLLVLLPGHLAPAKAAEPEIDYDINVSTAEQLLDYLTRDDNIIVNVTQNISAQVGKAGDTSTAYQDYWCRVGKGVKILNLNGHSIEISNDSFQEGSTLPGYKYVMTMFLIEGGELVINDPGDGGKITYKCMLKKDMRKNAYYTRNIFEVKTGGKLTVNGGKIVAGRRSDKYFYGVDYYYVQTNGIAIVVNGGEAVINGGTIEGRGYLMSAASTSNSYYFTEACAVYVLKGTLKVYDGRIDGAGNADSFRTKESGCNVAIYGGSFNLYKTDYEIYLAINGSFHYSPDPEYGVIGLPGWAFTYVGTRTQVYLNGTGMLTAAQVGQNLTLNTSRYVVVQPIEYQTGTVRGYNRVSNTYSAIAAGHVFEWDKETSLCFSFTYTPYYPALRSFDKIRDYEVDTPYATLTCSPDGANYVPAIHPSISGRDWIDLNDLPKASKDKLKVGNTYYVRLGNYTKWQSTPTAHEIRFTDDLYVKVKIVEPDLTAPELNLDFEWENLLLSSGGVYMRMEAAGDGTVKKLNNMKHEGKFSSYVASFCYYDTNGKWTNDSRENTTGGMNTANFYRGISTARYLVQMYKGGNMIGSSQKDKKVVHFPDLKSSVTPDSSNRVLVKPSASNKKVTLSCNANSYTGIFWAKDGAKISGSSGKSTWTVDLADGKNAGWYSLGYTLDGKDYISPEQFYLGYQEGSRNVSISSSATNSQIKADGNATPTLSASTSGTGWGTIDRYKWKNVDWPEGGAPVAIYKTTTAPSVNMAELVGCKGHETNLAEGTYTFSVTAYDKLGNSATSGTVSVKVTRPATGLEIWQYVISDSRDSINLTNGFTVLYSEYDTGYMYPEFTPKNAVGGTVSYTSSNTAVADFADSHEGDIEAYKAGTTTVTARYGTYTAQTQVLVPKTMYDITVPESWLEAEAGQPVQRGMLDIPASEDFTAELIWYAKGSWTNYEFTGDTFVGNQAYYPMIRIYPKSGVCYPVDIEYYSYRTDYEVDRDRFEITVNGETYYGGVYCGADTFYDAKPVSTGDKHEDFIDLDMDPTDILIDPRDEYISYVSFTVEVPGAGDPKDVTEDTDSCLNVTYLTEGVGFGGDAVYHITDVSTIWDSDYSNDATEENFTEYEEGEWYRYTLWIGIDRTYRTALGGVAYFDEGAVAYDADLDSISDGKYASSGLLIAYVYFTPGEGSALTLRGDMNGDGKVTTDDAIYLLRHVLMPSSYPISQSGDVNGDGKLTTDDAIYLLRYVLMPSSYPLH